MIIGTQSPQREEDSDDDEDAVDAGSDTNHEAEEAPSTTSNKSVSCQPDVGTVSALTFGVPQVVCY